MAEYRCVVCEYIYDEKKGGEAWADLPDDWLCPVCGSPKKLYEQVVEKEPEKALANETPPPADTPGDLAALLRPADEFETTMADIHEMAETGQPVSEPMRTRQPIISWDDLLIKGAQLAKLPLNANEPVATRTVIGPGATSPLVLETPVYISHMSFGALSKEAKIALATGSAAVRTAMCSGEGGILPESFEKSHRYIFEYIPNQYSVNEDNLRKVDAIEIKFGQSAKPGMGGHLPGSKVTEDIARIRGFEAGKSITSPARYPDILSREDLREKVTWLREKSRGKPIGIKFAAGHVEADLEIALFAGPDFITIDGRAGSTGSAPKFIKAATGVPTLFALYRARKYLQEHDVTDVSLIITGGLRISADFAKALAMGADAVAIGTSALMAIGCQQYKICNTGKCPMGIATQDPKLRANLNVSQAAKRLKNFLNATTDELKNFARLTGNADIHGLSVSDLCTTNSEISRYTDVEHV